MTLIVLVGAVLGATLWMLVMEVVQPRPRLVDAVAALDARRNGMVTRPTTGVTRASAARSRLLGQLTTTLATHPVATRLWGDDLTADLRLLGIDRGEFLARRVLTGIVVLVLAPVPLAVTAAATGVPIVATVPVILLLVALAILLPISRVRRRATAARFRVLSSLSAYVGIVGSMVAAGVADPQALGESATIGDGRVWRMLRAYIRSAPVRHETPAAALVRLSREIRVPDLGELGTQMDRAMRTGSPSSESLRAKSHALRDRVVAQMLGEGSQRSALMALAMVVFAIAHLLMLLYPALVGLLSGA